MTGKAPTTNIRREALIARRKALGLTQVKAAAACGWQQGRWSDLERGRLRNPTLATMRTAARVLDAGIEELFPT